MSNRPIPGARDVRATLDGDGTASAAVLACPPHPQFSGNRHDSRLQAVGDALVDRDVDCLRIDYGAWDEGVGERTDARNALGWAAGEYERVGLFGYSFGACVALLVAGAADPDAPPAAVSALAPDAVLAGDADVVAGLESIACPVQIIAGERDDTVNWEPVVDRARKLDMTVATIPADHHFVGQASKVGDLAGGYLAEELAK